MRGRSYFIFAHCVKFGLFFFGGVEEEIEFQKNGQTHFRFLPPPFFFLVGLESAPQRNPGTPPFFVNTKKKRLVNLSMAMGCYVPFFPYRGS